MSQAISPYSKIFPQICIPQNFSCTKASIVALSLFSLSMIGLGIGIQSNPTIVFGSISFVISGSGLVVIHKAKEIYDLDGVVVDRKWNFVKKKGEGILPDEILNNILLKAVEQCATIERIKAIFTFGIVCKQWCRVTRTGNQPTALLFKDFYGQFFLDQKRQCYFAFPLHQQFNSEMSKIFSFEDLFNVPSVKNINLNSNEIQISLFQKAQSPIIKGQTENGAWFFLILCKSVSHPHAEENSPLLPIFPILILLQERAGKEWSWCLTSIDPLEKLLPVIHIDIDTDTGNSKVTKWISRVIHNQVCGNLRYLSKNETWQEHQDYKIKLCVKKDL